jgi:outer membrane biogenesis lipoprotein LolB
MEIEMKRLLFGLAAVAVALSAGCTSKSNARAKANAAFIAGQQQAWTQYQQAHPMTVRVLGPVRQPVLDWTDTLTVSSTIVASGYQGPTPRVVIVYRNGTAIPVDPKQLLAGEDMPLLPGDSMEIRP